MPPHPPFVDVKFYPGYFYQRGDTLCSGAGRYVGLTRDGEVYVFRLDSNPSWEKI